MHTRLKIGLILAILLGLADAALPLSGLDGPPMPVAIGAAALGVITIVAAIAGWTGRRAANVTVIAARVVSALAAVPAFFVADVPAAAKISAAAIIVLTVAAVLLIGSAVRRAT